MISGDTIVKLLKLETLAGRALSYASKALAAGDGFDFTWRDTAGVALSSQPTWTLADEGSGWHRLTYTVLAGVWWVEPTLPSWAADIPRWGGEGQSYDEDALAGLIQTSAGVPGVQSAADGDLGDVVDGDAWNSGTLYIPLGKLTPFGLAYADLASGFTYTAGFKSDPADTMISSGTTVTPGASVAVDGAFKVSWATFQTGMNLSSTERQKDWFLDIQLKQTAVSRIITTNRYALRVVWQRNTAT